MTKTTADIGRTGGVIELPAVGAGAKPDRRRWLILGTVSLAQLMVVLDSTARR